MRKKKQHETNPPKHGGGPKTPAGKEISKRNSTKSGLYAGPPLIKTEYYSEDAETLRRRAKKLRAYYDPEGEAEERCILEILYYDQCLERAKMYEVGRIESGLRRNEKSCKSELTPLQAEIDVDELELQDFRKRRQELSKCEVLDPDKLSDIETHHLIDHAMCMLDNLDQAALNRATKLDKLFHFLREQFGWDAEKVCAILVTYLDGYIVVCETELSEVRSELNTKTASLADRIKRDAPQFLLVDSDTFEKIERARSAYSKHLQQATEMLLKQQAARLQKK